MDGLSPPGGLLTGYLYQTRHLTVVAAGAQGRLARTTSAVH